MWLVVVIHTLLPSFQYQPGLNRQRLYFCPLLYILASFKQQEEEHEVWLQGSRFNVLAWVWQEYFILFFNEIPLWLFEHFLPLWISLIWLFLNIFDHAALMLFISQSVALCLTRAGSLPPCLDTCCQTQLISCCAADLFLVLRVERAVCRVESSRANSIFFFPELLSHLITICLFYYFAGYLHGQLVSDR